MRLFLLIVLTSLMSQSAFAGKNRKSGQGKLKNNLSPSRSESRNRALDTDTKLGNQKSEEDEENLGSKKIKGKKNSVTQSPDQELKGESASKRVRSKFLLEGKSLAISDFFLNSGIGGGYSINADLETSIMVLAGSKDLTGAIPSDEFVSVDHARASSLIVAGNARYFFGNSFSAQGGGLVIVRHVWN